MENTTMTTAEKRVRAMEIEKEMLLKEKNIVRYLSQGYVFMVQDVANKMSELEHEYYELTGMYWGLVRRVIYANI